MIGTIEKLGSQALRQVTPEVEEINGKTVSIINRMRFFLYQADGVGLAANQIDINQRIFVYDIGLGFNAVINPEIAERQDELWLHEEGCLSVPGYYFPIWRPKKVYLKGFDINGDPFEMEAVDILARVFMHEVDHLFGKLVTDLLSEDERKEFNKKWHLKHQKKKSKRKNSR
jgi:peptide deformylase